MARVYLFAEPGPLVRVFYTIDQAVGKNSPNQREDVFLVQFFLRRVLEGQHLTIPGESTLAIDGLYGNQTARYIEFYQKHENLVQDGVVSSPGAGRIVQAPGGEYYMILSLNLQYGYIFGREQHANIAQDPLCPTGQFPSIFFTAGARKR
jgi:hypothetical protein